MVLWEEEVRSDIYVEGYNGVTREGFTEDKTWKAVTGRGEVKQHTRQRELTQNELPEKSLEVYKWSSEVRR